MGCMACTLDDEEEDIIDNRLIEKVNSNADVNIEADAVDLKKKHFYS